MENKDPTHSKKPSPRFCRRISRQKTHSLSPCQSLSHVNPGARARHAVACRTCRGGAHPLCCRLWSDGGRLRRLPPRKLSKLAPFDRDQLVPRALLDNTPVLDHGDGVSVADGAEPMRNRDGRPALPLHDRVNGSLNDALARREDGRLAHNCTSDCDALLLAAREHATALADGVVVSAWQVAHDEAMSVCAARGLLDLLSCGAFLTIGNILHDAAHEEHRLLANKPDLLP
eukprot:scaffold274353_cov30-Tisochrysis_lutea.AAC.3